LRTHVRSSGAIRRGPGASGTPSTCKKRFSSCSKENAAIDLGDPAERHELPRGSVCVVQPGTPLQLRNDGDKDVLFFIVGAPPEESGADYFPDVD
jgi:hypothetical protein